MKAIASLLLLSAISVISMSASFAEPLVCDEGKPTYECRRTQGIVIDGKLDDPAWQDAQLTDNFVFPWPEQTGPRFSTKAALLWDDANLYVAYRCEDEDITAGHTQWDDPTYEDDCVEIFIAANPAKSKMYYGFELNCRAVLYDYFYAFPDCLLTHWDTGGVRLKTDIQGTLNQSDDTDSGWTLEIAIPFKNLKALTGKDRPEAGDLWRINMNRWDGTGSKRALSQWTPSGLKNPHPHRPEGFGALHFAGE